MRDTILQNGYLVSEDGVVKADLLIQNGKIAKIAAHIEPSEAHEIIDAAGMMVLPGAIDTHAHLSEPAPHCDREDWAHGSRAAASGGVTTVAAMPMPCEAVLDAERFQRKKTVAGENSVVDFMLWGVVCPDNLEEMEALHNAGCAGFNGFMGSFSEGYLFEAMERAKALGALIAVYADMRAKAPDRQGCAECEAEARAAALASVAGGRLLICHNAIPEGAKLYVETCPYSLCFDRAILCEKMACAKCAPPFRDRARAEKLWKAVLNGEIDVIGSDHCPYTNEEKTRQGNFWREKCGRSGIDVTLHAMITRGVHGRGLSWSRLAALTSGNAARMLGVYPQKGSLLPGADADIALIDPEEVWVYDGLKSLLKVKSDKGVYQGMQMKGRVRRTLLRGETIYRDGAICAESGCGRFLRAARNS